MGVNDGLGCSETPIDIGCLFGEGVGLFFIDDFAAEDGVEDFGGRKSSGVDFEDILGEDDHIGKFSDFEGSFDVFFEGGVGGAAGVIFNCLFDSEFLI